MKIVFRKSISDQIMDHKLNAQLADKEIEKIILGQKEYNRFKAEMHLMDYRIKDKERLIGTFDGTPLYVEGK